MRRSSPAVRILWVPLMLSIQVGGAMWGLARPSAAMDRDMTIRAASPTHPAPVILSASSQTAPLGRGVIFTFLYLLLGPNKVLAPFVKLTQGTDARYSRRLAFRAFLLSIAALAIAALLGEGFLTRYGIHVRVLNVTGGLIIFLVALQKVLQQYAPPGQAPETDSAPSLHQAARTLAFPTIVTPPGIAAVIIFLTVSPTTAAKLQIGGLIVAILVLDLLAMLFARPALKWLGTPLSLFDVVLGVIQVALGLEIMLVYLAAMGIFPYHP